MSVLSEAVQVFISDIEVTLWFAESFFVFLPVSVKVLFVVETLCNNDPVIDTGGGYFSLTRMDFMWYRRTFIIVWLVRAVLELRRLSFTPLDDVLAIRDWPNW